MANKKLPAVKPAYVMKMNADEARSERERQHCHYHAEYFDACANCADAEKLWRSGWDAAIDAAAKVARDKTVAPPLESKRTFTSEEWYAMFCKKCGGATNYATVNAGRGVCRCPEQPKTGAAPAVSTPQCPVCKSLRVQFYFGDGDVLFACRECGHQATGKEITDLVRVFQPAPSPPCSLIGAVYVDNPRFKGYGFAVSDSGQSKRTIGVLLENGNVWEYDATTVRAASPDEYHKMPRKIQELAAPSPQGESK